MHYDVLGPARLLRDLAWNENPSRFSRFGATGGILAGVVRGKPADAFSATEGDFFPVGSAMRFKIPS
jgi:hypothetical protein